eukprot:803508-Rhodomonas_salina.2
MKKFHTDEYIDFLLNISPDNMDVMHEGRPPLADISWLCPTLFLNSSLFPPSITRLPFLPPFRAENETTQRGICRTV